MEANVDKKTGVTTITVTMQDAEVAATVADSVVVKLQDYVTAYRTKKLPEIVSIGKSSIKRNKQSIMKLSKIC